jgi:IS5 family transposase
MKGLIGEDKFSILIHSVEATAANVHDLTRAAELLHGEEAVVYSVARDQGIEKRPEMNGKGISFRDAMHPAKGRALLVIAKGQLDDLVETAKAHIRDKSEHPIRVIQQQYGFPWTWLRSILKNPCITHAGSSY